MRSTYLLRNWLLSIKPQQLYVERDTEEALEVSQAVSEQEQRLAIYHQRILGSLPVDELQWTAQDRVSELVFQLLDFHRRADKPVYWDMFKRQDMERHELIEDIESLAGLERTAQPPVPEKRSFLYQYSFPEQETKLRAGTVGKLIETLSDITLHELDVDGRLVTFKSTKPLPASFDVGPGGPVNTRVIREALFRYADSVLSGVCKFRAIDDFLRRQYPRIGGVQPGAVLLDPRLAPLEAVKQVVFGLDDSVLFIQGPPGAGKTFTGAHLIADLLKAGKRVGVTSNSHHAIHNLLAAVEQRAAEISLSFVGLKKSSRGAAETCFISDKFRSFDDKDALLDHWGAGASLVAGTAWLFADEDFTEQLDYLFIDEAGQVSVANLVAMGMASRNLVLMGDQMQLAQPVKGVHPGRSGDSALDYLLDGLPVIPAERGVFLAQTWRMHPDVCSFISEAVYDGQLTSAPGTELQRLILDGAQPSLPATGLYFRGVMHDGNSQSSEEEAEVVSVLALTEN